jgi:hypothetical protein
VQLEAGSSPMALGIAAVASNAGRQKQQRSYRWGKQTGFALSLMLTAHKGGQKPAHMGAEATAWSEIVGGARRSENSSGR